MLSDKEEDKMSIVSILAVEKDYIKFGEELELYFTYSQIYLPYSQKLIKLKQVSFLISPFCFYKLNLYIACSIT